MDFMKLNYNLLSEHRMNINRLITFLICFVFIGQAQADKLPVEIWECSKDSTVIVKAKVFKGKRSGSIEVSGVTHETSLKLMGLTEHGGLAWIGFTMVIMVIHLQ